MKIGYIDQILSVLILLVFLLPACQPDTPLVITETPLDPPATEIVAKPTQPIRFTQTSAPFTPTLANTPTPTPAVSNLEVDLDKLQGLKITLWHPWVDLTAYQFENLIDQFNQTNPWGIQVDVRPMGGAGALSTQVSQALQLGMEPIHIVIAPIETLNGWQKKYGNVVDLSVYIHDSTYGLSDQEIADIPFVFLNQDRLGEVQLGIPAARTIHVLFYNGSFAQSLGFDNPPASIEDFKQQVCAAARANKEDQTRANDGTGGWLVSYDPLGLLSWYLSFGGEVLTGEDQTTFQFNTEAGLSMFGFMKGLVDEGCAWIAKDPEPYTHFASRRTLIYSGVLEDVQPQEKAMQQAGSQDNWTILPYPPDSRGKPVLIGSGPSYAMFTATPEEELAAWLVIRYLASADSQIKLVPVSYSLPVRTTAVQGLEVFSRYHPQWAAANGWMPMLQPSPRLASWRIARNILSDAFWQVTQPQTKAESLPLILQELDSTIQEVLEEQRQ